MTKKWPEKVGVLHANWIENRQGKSIDTSGNILFPQYDYTHIEQYGDCFILTVGGKKGIVQADGKKITDFKYYLLVPENGAIRDMLKK